MNIKFSGRASCVMNVFAFLAVKMDFVKNLWNVNVMKGGKGCFVTNVRYFWTILSTETVFKRFSPLQNIGKIDLFDSKYVRTSYFPAKVMQEKAN